MSGDIEGIKASMIEAFAFRHIVRRIHTRHAGCAGNGFDICLIINSRVHSDANTLFKPVFIIVSQVLFRTADTRVKSGSGCRPFRSVMGIPTSSVITYEIDTLFTCRIKGSLYKVR